LIGRRPRLPVAILVLVLLGTLVPRALASELRCRVCGEEITGGYVELDGKVYHERCYREKVQPRCAVCNKPIEGAFVQEAGKSYHPACLKARSTRCVICGEVLKGNYLADPWGNPFHSRHGRKVLCPFCNRAMADSTTGGSVVAANGMRICRLCEREGVERKGRAESLLERTRLKLSDSFPVPASSFSFELVDKPRLNELLSPGRQLGVELGITLEKKARWGRKESIHNDMFLLSGLPEWLFEAVAAHELVHVWQHLQGLDDLPADQAEGSAELASYLVLKRNGSREARVKMEAMERSDDPSYGAGLRRALEVSMNGQDVSRLHRALRGEGEWPGGS